MAIGTPTQTISATTTSTGTSLTGTVSANVSLGNLHFVACAVPGSAEPAVSVTDSGGNTYSLAFEERVGVGTQHTLALYYTIISSALTSGVSTVTWTWTNSRAFASLIGAQASGIAASPLDKTANAEGTGTTSVSSGATSTTAQADELLVGAASVRNNTTIVPATFTEIGSDVTVSTMTINLAYSIVAATGTYTYDATAGASSTFGAGIATFKGDAAAPTPSTRLEKLMLRGVG